MPEEGRNSADISTNQLNAIIIGERTKRKGALWPTLLSVVIACLGSVTDGYGISYSSSALLELAELPGEFAFEKGGVASQLFAALLPIGIALAAPFGGLLADRGGRKVLLLSLGVPNFVGWLLIALSKYMPLTVFKPVILTGRFLTGFAIGWIATGVPLYAAEISDCRWRGLFSAFYQISLVIGIFLSYAVSAIPNVSYTHTAFVGTGLVVLFLILGLTLHESPRFLLCKGRESKAKKVLYWLRQSTEVAEEELAEIKHLIETSPKLSLKRKLQEFKAKHVYIPLILSLVLVFFRQFCGINVIVYYAASIFQTAGVTQARETALYAIGGVQIIATVMSSGTVDFAGRKVLLVIGSVGMALSSAALGTHFFITRPEFCDQVSANWSNEFLNTSTAPTCNPQFGPLAITSLIAFIFAFSIGWRSIPYIVMNELLPLRIRGFLGGITVSILGVFSSVITGFYQSFESTVGPYTAWWVFAFLSFVGIFFVLFFLPETKGKTLEEIEMYFKSKKHKEPLHTTNPLSLDGIAETEQCMYEIIRKETSV